jgi:hypothetical protein
MLTLAKTNYNTKAFFCNSAAKKIPPGERETYMNKTRLPVGGRWETERLFFQFN